MNNTSRNSVHLAGYPLLLLVEGMTLHARHPDTKPYIQFIGKCTISQDSNGFTTVYNYIMLYHT